MEVWILAINLGVDFSNDLLLWVNSQLAENATIVHKTTDQIPMSGFIDSKGLHIKMTVPDTVGDPVTSIQIKTKNGHIIVEDTNILSKPLGVEIDRTYTLNSRLEVV